MKCIILEDNPQDLELIRWYITQESSLELKESFTSVPDALSYINEFEPPLLFMDIDMPVIKGIDLYKKLQYHPICVFVTAHSEYAIESYETQAFDFILKPLTANRFNRCVNRLKEYEQLKKRADLYDTLFESQSIMIKEGSTVHRVPLNDIIYIEALNDYSKVVTKTKNYITLSKLKHFLEKLPKKDFIRIHRSYAVAKQSIELISGNELKIAGQQLPIGKTFRLSLKMEFTS
ncbi:two component transcriptional regulator, LytTR family [Chitinophaga sp. YR573]|uniref:LytR/AlgR family response regulator transcription factor n=1 Tax=Chitinophaga sp. YR573 TaxID=1881040 RepID=UPI0008B90596|nr:LytTR family DNA-binding domain-containing protein [Chitinophaga sp. YR573]SEV93441.1 two component transcriptional regulator, LytTR family [Chitinophaga sp. YR573]